MRSWPAATHAGARELLTRAIRSEPTSGRLHFLQAHAAVGLGDGATGEAEIGFARRYGVSEAETRPLLAEALVQQGAPERALAELDAGPVLRSLLGAAFRVRGGALALTGDDAGAKIAYDRAVLAAPRDPRVWTDLGRFRATRGDDAGARLAAERALAYSPRDVVALTLRGDLARSQEGLAAGMAWYDRAIAIDPANTAALVARAAAAGEMGRTRQLLADTRAALALDPHNAMAWYLQAVLAARARAFALAGRLMDSTGDDLDGMPGAMLLEGAIGLHTGNVEHAISRLARLVGDQPGNRAARRLLAAAQWQAGDAFAAGETLRPLAEDGEADAWSRLLLARTAERQGDRVASAAWLDSAMSGPAASAPAIDPAAIGALRSAARSAPGDALKRIALIRGLIRGRLYDEAMAEALDLRTHNPGVADAHALVGDVDAALGRWAEAAAAYRDAARIAFSETTVLRLVDALHRSGQGVEAAHALATFRAQYPRSVPARLLAAESLMGAGQWTGAVPLLEGLRRDLGDRNASLLANLAWGYAHAGRRADALALGEKAWRLLPASPGLAHSYGWLLYNVRGDRRLALALLDQAARQLPENATVAQHLALARSAARAGDSRTIGCTWR